MIVVYQTMSFSVVQCSKGIHWDLLHFYFHEPGSRICGGNAVGDFLQTKGFISQHPHDSSIIADLGHLVETMQRITNARLKVYPSPRRLSYHRGLGSKQARQGFDFQPNESRQMMLKTRNSAIPPCKCPRVVEYFSTTD